MCTALLENQNKVNIKLWPWKIKKYVCVSKGWANEMNNYKCWISPVIFKYVRKHLKLHSTLFSYYGALDENNIHLLLRYFAKMAIVLWLYNCCFDTTSISTAMMQYYQYHIKLKPGCSILSNWLVCCKRNLQVNMEL